MWKKTSSYVLLAAFAAAASAQNAAASGSSDVLITMSVQIDGSTKDLQLMRGESIEDAAVSFARNNGLLSNGDATRVRAVVDQLSGLLRGRMEEIQASEAAKPTVQFAMPLTINGATREIKKYEGETVEASVERFLYDGGYSMDVMRELYPQLVDVVINKLAELKLARKELFSFTLTIDGREATARHFDKGDSMEEARETLRGVGFTDTAFIERLAPQIAQEINRRIASTQGDQWTQPPAQPPAPVQPPAPTPAQELFSIPLTVNERPTILVHYDGYTSRESAIRYLNDNGLSRADSAERMMGQLVQIIDNRIAEIAREQAAQEATARAAAEEVAAQQRAEAEAAARAAQETALAREPLVRLPINLGNNQEATLQYFEGDSVERTVEVFLTQIGMQAGPMFNQNVERLAVAVRDGMKTALAERAAQAPHQQQPQMTQPPAEPYVQLPVTLSGRVFDLTYYIGEQPATVANTFCVEKHEIIRTELGLQFDGDQLVECKNLLERTLNNLIAQKQRQQQGEEKEQVTQPSPAAPEQPPQQQTQQEPPQQPRSRGEYLLSLDIDIDGQNVSLNVHQNDDPEQIARAFCDQHKVSYGNVGPLVQAIQEQLARLK